MQTLNVAAMDHRCAAMREKSAERVLGDQVLQLRVDACALGAVDEGARLL